MDGNADPEQLFSMSQRAHSEAQGKVGSGFDVSTAVYGSHVFSKFSPPSPFSTQGEWMLMMGDVKSGSESAGMSRKVLKVRDGENFQKLQEAVKAAIEKYTRGDASFGGGVRALMRAVGEESGADVEPPSQTALCDATEGIEGVVYCGVPGAGGYDAVVCVCEGEAVGRVEECWMGRGVEVLRVREAGEGMTVVRS